MSRRIAAKNFAGDGWRVPAALLVVFGMAHSVADEMIEWLAALMAAPELGQAYLGTQGDPWDSQKDMALATAGALVTLCILRFMPGWTARFSLSRTKQEPKA